MTCQRHASGDLELYFYDELSSEQRAAAEQHLSNCADCRAILDELHAMRTALASGPDVSTPPSGDWSPFMSRLDAAIASERSRPPAFVSRRRGRYAEYVAIAALLALVTFSVAVAFRARHAPVAAGTAGLVPRAAPAARDNTAFAAMTEQHFERSKLVVLGLATKDPARQNAADWAYERELATSLLDDTRLYRLAAQDRGLDALAGVMTDLELVLLQTSLTDGKDPAALPQLQRLIRRRDLIEKMDVVGTTGL
ncbi:MAG: anti-sigma factor family protein [Vicinamibacterales bacterium]